MKSNQNLVSFQRAVAGAGPTLYLSAAFSNDLQTQNKYYPRNRLFQFILQSQTWLAHDIPLYTMALCTAVVSPNPQEVLVALGYEGKLFFKDSEIGSYEDILYKDPFDNGLVKFLAVRDLMQINSFFYACGFDGKIVRRLAENSWELLTPQLVTDFAARSAALDDATVEDGDDWLEKGLSVLNSDQWQRDQRKEFNKIQGISESEIYVTGHDGGMLFWDGQQSRWVDGTPKVSLFGMHVEEGNVWVCGSQGTILHGNYHDGFDDYSLGTDHSFNKIIRFKGKIYLSANGGFGGPVGLFTYDGHKLEQVSCGLIPDIHDIHTVTAADGILWAVGYRDILYFDGKTWHRIDHPDNPPVR